MQSLRDIKRRIRSVKNIAQITKAMEVVSMNKMRRTQRSALAARPYSLAALHMLVNLLKMTPKNKLPDILRERPIKNLLLVAITTDKGLVGGFNDNVLRKMDAFISRRNTESVSYKIVTIGKKAKEHSDRKGYLLAGSFVGHGDFVDMEETSAAADFILNGFMKKEWDAVTVVYTHFKTTLKQETKEKKILPTRQKTIEETIDEIIPEYGLYSEIRKEKMNGKTHYNFTYKFEPSAERILHDLASDLLRFTLHDIMLESNASEHSSRMVTMKNASDNASDLRSKLTLSFNKARQAGITAELSEIVAGAEALK